MTLLHALPDFKDLLVVVADKLKIDPGLAEKDCWIWPGCRHFDRRRHVR